MTLSFSILDDFEKVLSDYTGAPFVVLTDCCTHAIELCFRYKGCPDKVEMTHSTYISAVMVLHKLGIEPVFKINPWRYEYQYGNTGIWDSARGLREDMYQSGQMQCLSFGHSKRLELGHGGAILLDDKEAYSKIKRMAYDGRDLQHTPWDEQFEWEVGYHYNMRLETAELGRDMLLAGHLKSLESQQISYPNISKIRIKQ